MMMILIILLQITPTAFAVARILEQDFTFSGYRVKAGVSKLLNNPSSPIKTIFHLQNIVLCQNMIACNKDENFENAKTFAPERWLNENGELNPNQCSGSTIVVPFGCGK
jgi:ecdysone 20-monooxygenase